MLLIHYSVSMVLKREGESCTVLQLSPLEHLSSYSTLELVTLHLSFQESGICSAEAPCGWLRVLCKGMRLGHSHTADSQSCAHFRRLLSPWQ